jgi:hypothetical protein
MIPKQGLRLALWNVQGISDRRAQSLVSQVLHLLRVDIAILTETNLGSPPDPPWAQWNQVWTTSPQARGTGVAVLSLSSVSILQSRTEEDGRVIEATVELGPNKLNLVAVYGPADASIRRQWYSQNLTPNKLGMSHIDVLAGDFNCEVNPSSRSPGSHELWAFVQTYGLVDVPPTNRDYTFRSAQGYKSRIDRFYLAPHWVAAVRQCWACEPPKSNHQIVLLDLHIGSGLVKGPGVWRLNPQTAQNPEGIKEIETLIERMYCTRQRDPVKQWLEMKKRVRSIYAAKQKQLIQRSKRQEEQARAILTLYQSDKYHEEIERAKQTLARITEERLQMAKIAAGIKWDVSIETPSKYVTARIKARETQKLIRCIKNPTSGKVEHTIGAIKEAFVQYYTNLFRRREINKDALQQLLEKWEPPSAEILNTLNRPITEEEVRRVIGKLNPHKAPGPDGLTAWFYRIHSRHLVPWLTEIFERFRQQGSIPPRFKEGLMVTIYKGKGDPLDIANRRPITLLNGDYKILAKILVERLKPLLSKLIAPSQTGFIPGRNMIDNLVVLSDIFDFTRKSSASPAPTVTFIDFEKAYDSISHEALVEILKHLHFPTEFVKLIQAMLEGASIRINVNGHITEPIKLQRGTRQGDPISPLLFAIGIEALNRSILHDSQLCGLPFSPIHRIKALLYADDVLLAAPSQHELDRMLVYHVDVFCRATGMAVSEKKSRCLPIGWNGEGLRSRYALVTKQEPERYLGHWFGPEGHISKVTDILENIKASLIKIKQSHLTIGAKVMMWNTYFLPRLTYALWCELPKPQLYNQTNKLLQWFLWSSSKSPERTISRVGMDRMRQPPNKGGWKIIEVETRHTVQLAWLFERALHPLPAHISPLYSGAWRKQILQVSTRTSISFLQPSWKGKIFLWSRLLTAAANSWKWVQMKGNVSTPTLIRVGEEIKLNKIYQIANTIPPPRLTPSQIEWQSKFGVKWDKVWCKIHRLRRAPHLRDLLWKIYARALPLYKLPHPKASCDRCGLLETTLHIFFECPAAREVVEAIQPLHKALFGSELKWEPQAVLPLTFTQRRMRSLKLFFVATTYRLLWTLRNKRKHGEHTLSPQAVPSAIGLELARAASADWALTREALRKNRIGKGAESTEDVRRQIKAFKKRWAIPRFFRLDGYRVFPLTQ